MSNKQTVYDALIIGAGQTGLATGFKLQQEGLNFLILEGREQVEGSFGSYYDSLKLFTPVPFSQLPGMDMKYDKRHYPSRDEFIGYLQDYAKGHELPVQTATKVEKVARHELGFLLSTNQGEYLTRSVIDASGPYNDPLIPQYPNQEAYKGQILHSYAYRNTKGFEGKRIIIVGAGNSALQIAMELKDVANVTLGIRRKIKWVSQRILGLDIHWWMHTFGVDHFPLKEKPKGGIPVIDIGGYRKSIKRGELDIRKIYERFTETGVVWPDGTAEDIDIVLYATGYEPKYQWLQGLDVFNDKGCLAHDNGVSTKVPGLYFAGLFLQRNAASGNIRGAAYDAEYIARRVAHHLGKSSNSSGKDVWGVAFKQMRRKMV